MIEAVRLTGYALGLLALFAALGATPALVLARGVAGRAVLAPVAGFALAQCLLTSAGYLVTMEVAAWAVLLPAAVLSLGAAVVILRREGAPRPDPRHLAVPAGLGAAALVLALLPGWIRGTVGPVALYFSDGWGYIVGDVWLRGHTIAEDVPQAASRTDLIDFAGWFNVGSLGARPGAMAVNGAVSELFGTLPDRTHLALLAAVFAMVPGVVWLLARSLGAGGRAAAIGAAFGCSPAVLMLVGDSALANLAGLVLWPVALWATARAAARGGWRRIVLAGLLVGGALAGFAESVGVVALVVLAAAAAVAGSRRHSPRAMAAMAGRVAMVAVATAVIAPGAVDRGRLWLDFVLNQGAPEYPDRHLTPLNGGPWLFGLVHLYDLPAVPAAAMAVLAALALALAALVGLGVARGGPRGALLVLAPILTPLALGTYSYLRYDRCEYCAWKSYTLALPFVGVGIAMGLHAWDRRAGGRAGRVGRIRRAAPLAAALVAVAGMAVADARLIDVWRTTSNVITPAERRVSEAAAELGRTRGILLEGQDATDSPAWTSAEAYYLASRGTEGLISFDPTRPAHSYLVPLLAPADLHDPDYGHVLTTFSDIRGDRRTVARAGRFTLMRRAPIDVKVGRTGYALDPDPDAEAIPWVTGRFELWVSSPRPGPVALRVDFRPGPGQRGAVLQMTRGGAPLQAAHEGDRTAVCVDLRVRAGLTVVEATPALSAPPAGGYVIGPTGVDGPPFRGLAVEGLRADPGRCDPRAARTPEDVLLDGVADVEAAQLAFYETLTAVVVGSPGSPARAALAGDLAALDAAVEGLAARTAGDAALAVRRDGVVDAGRALVAAYRPVIAPLLAGGPDAVRRLVPRAERAQRAFAAAVARARAG